MQKTILNHVDKQNIGRCGELLVRYKLLLNGIESSHLSKDAGNYLIAYSQKCQKRTTIQVETILKAKTGGVREKLALDWWIEKNKVTDVIALVDLSRNKVWMFTKYELIKSAQKKSIEKQFYLCMLIPVHFLKKNR